MLEEIIQDRVMRRYGHDLQSRPVKIKDRMYVYELKSEDEKAIS